MHRTGLTIYLTILEMFTNCILERYTKLEGEIPMAYSLETRKLTVFRVLKVCQSEFKKLTVDKFF